MTTAGAGGLPRRGGRGVLLVLWLGTCVLLCAGLLALGRYIWAPLPAGYGPGEMPEGQGEGMALTLLFMPGVLVLVCLLVVPSLVVLGRRRRVSRPSAPATSQTPRPGWYPDPWASGSERWFDGHAWTPHLRETS